MHGKNKGCIYASAIIA